MAITPEEFQIWKERHATASAHLLEVIEKWAGRRKPLDPEARAAYDQDHQTVIEEFAQFKVMPEEVWDNIFTEEETTA